jgi:hypothetical protein
MAKKERADEQAWFEKEIEASKYALRRREYRRPARHARQVTWFAQTL